MDIIKSKTTQGLCTPEMIDYRLGSVELISDYARGQLANSLALLPKEVINFIVENYVFISREEDESGSQWTFSSVHFKDKKGFILLNSNIWEKKPTEIAFTIAHEVAHAFKGHEVGGITAKKGIKQEKEADKLAVNWLGKYYKKSVLIKLCKSKIHEKRYKSFSMKKVGCG